MSNKILESLMSDLHSLTNPPVQSPEEIASISNARQCRTQRCQKYFDSSLEGARSYGGGWYCGACAARYLVIAEDTGRLHYRTHLTRTVEGTNIFKTTNHIKCQNCGGWTKTVHDYGPRKVCKNCFDDLRRYKIKSSCENVLDHCKRRKPAADRLLMGVEWELDHMNDTDRTTDAIIKAVGEDFAIAKTDGSIGRGSEIVTVPASPKMLIKRLRKGCEQAASLISNSNEGTSSGIHIHVARKFFDNEDQMNAFIAFVNKPANRSLIYAIAGRYNSSWAKIFTPSFGQTWMEASRCLGKYASVNVLHRHTLEVRLFYSTTNADTLSARIEFVASLARFIKQGAGSTCQEYLSYISDRKDKYPYLWVKLKKSGIGVGSPE